MPVPLHCITPHMTGSTLLTGIPAGNLAVKLEHRSSCNHSIKASPNLPGMQYSGDAASHMT